jgi:CRISPR-associated protein Csx17
MPTLQLYGCALEPLGDYLKALGIFRLVSEQITPAARCWWKHGIFHLWLPQQTAYLLNGADQTIPFDEASLHVWLESFFVNACTYSPLLSPWQKNTGFLPYDSQKKAAKAAKVNAKTINRDKAAQEALSSILTCDAVGSEAYRTTIKKFADEFGLTLQAPEKDWVEKLKGINDPGLFKGLNSESEQGKNIGRKSAAQARLIERTRNACDNVCLTTWLDTVGHPRSSKNQFGREREWFSLLGDGAAEGSGGMIMRLETALADVLSRKREIGQEWLKAALWATPAESHLSEDYSIGLFYPHRKETPNSGQDFESKRTGAAWDVILLFEGVLLFAGSMARRLNVRKAVPAFPFYCGSSLGANPAAGSNEIEGSKKGISSGEVWCPVWSQPATLRDLTTLFSEGRMQIGGRDARLATQFIRALGRHGCDRGIDAFQRFALLRRSGSFGKTDQTSTLAVPLGLYTASPNSDLTLLDDLIDFEEDVLDASGRRAILDSDSQPRRIIQARRRFEEALFDASRSGLESHRQKATTGLSDFRLKLMDVAVAAARMERECGVTDGRIHDREGKTPDKDQPNAPCAPSLSYDWLRLRHGAPSEPPKRGELPDDGTTEWRLARALGTICPWGKKPEGSQRKEPCAVGPIRENLVRLVRSQGGEFWNWEPESRRAAWLWQREVLSNCAAVLHRRLIDAQGGSGNGLPLFSPYGANAADLLALWQGAVDEERLNEFLHGFGLIRPWRKVKSAAAHAPTPYVDTHDDDPESDNEFRDDGRNETPGEEITSTLATERWLERLDLAAQLPRAYALLKLCFLGGRLPPRPDVQRSGQEPYAPGNLNILNLLLAGRADDACTAAARRLHYAGYPPLFATSESFSAGFALSHVECRRLAGLLLMPVTFASDLARLVIKPSTKD